MTGYFFELDSVLAGAVQVVTLQQQTRRRRAHRTRRLTNRGQWRLEHSGEFGIVESNHGDIFRYAQPDFSQGTQGSGSHRVARQEYTPDLITIGEHAFQGPVADFVHLHVDVRQLEQRA